MQNMITELRSLNDFLTVNKDIVQDLLKLRPMKGYSFSLYFPSFNIDLCTSTVCHYEL